MADGYFYLLLRFCRVKVVALKHVLDLNVCSRNTNVFLCSRNTNVFLLPTNVSQTKRKDSDV